MQRRLVSLVVNNQPGVLTRVAGLFTRRGYNIDSLTVSATQDPAFSRITVVVTADETMLEQVVRQVEKLIDIKVVQVLDYQPVTRTEVALVKVGKGQGHGLMDIVNAAHAAIVDMGEHTVTVQATGSLEELDHLIGQLAPYGIVEMARSGLVALSRGDGGMAIDFTNNIGGQENG
jgi:acetolactate synthase I/III small subunit